MTRILPALALLLLLAASAVACGPSLQTRQETLHDTARQYNDDLRWKRLRSAARAVPVERRAAWLASMERAARAFTIVDHEVTPVRVQGDVAVLQVDVAYHRAGGVHIHRTRRQQVWRHEGSGWMLEADKEIPREEEPPPTGFPDFGAQDGDGASP